MQYVYRPCKKTQVQQLVKIFLSPKTAAGTDFLAYRLSTVSREALNVQTSTLQAVDPRKLASE